MVVLFIEENIVDVTSVLNWHPGGAYYLKSNNEKDVTDIFFAVHPNIHYKHLIIGKRKKMGNE